MLEQLTKQVNDSLDRQYEIPLVRKWIVDRFHKLFYGTKWKNGPWADMYWMGARTFKCPMDMWILQEIIWECRPNWIVECGTHQGGSALFFASICDLVGQGQVITIDVMHRNHLPEHSRIIYLTGSSTAHETFETVSRLTGHSSSVLVVLDSDHRYPYVIQEMNLYSQIVTLDQYLVVEDTNLNGHPIRADFGPGPMEAVKTFLANNSNFVVDHSREKMYLTFNPNGYLKRIK
jgi:cephalosporin hydroxylase